MFNATSMRRRAGSFLFGGGSLLLAAALVLINPGILPGVEATPPPAQSCNVTYFALDPANPLAPNPAKEVPAAFGPEVTARGEDPVKAELNERRECGADGKFDPALTASHYSAWSEAGLTHHKVAFTEIDAFYAKIAADGALYNEVLTELKGLENASAYSEEGVGAGIWSLYMDPNGSGQVNVKQGRTSADGTNAVFTHPSGTVIKYRLDCGFQVNREGEFPGVPQCTPETCPPPTCPPGWGEWPNCLEPKDVSQSWTSNDDVADWKKDGDDRHDVSYEDGSKVANGYQGDPEGDARRAAEEAARQAAADQAAHEEAVEEAVVVEEDQEIPAGPTPLPTPTW